MNFLQPGDKVTYIGPPSQIFEYDRLYSVMRYIHDTANKEPLVQFNVVGWGPVWNPAIYFQFTA